MNNRAQMQLFGGEHWKTILQIKSHLVTKAAQGTSTGAVFFLGTVVEQMLQKIMVLLHVALFSAKVRSAISLHGQELFRVIHDSGHLRRELQRRCARSSQSAIFVAWQNGTINTGVYFAG